MVTDIGQTRDISKEQPEERQRLKTIADDWKKDILDHILQPDVERFPIGYSGAPLTELPARDGYGEGGVVHSGRAPNCSFFTPRDSNSKSSSPLEATSPPSGWPGDTLSCCLQNNLGDTWGLQVLAPRLDASCPCREGRNLLLSQDS